MAAVCGVASKEVALTVPIVIVLWDRVFAFPTFRAAWAERRRLYAMVTASWLLFVIVGRTVESTASGVTMSPATYLFNQGPVIVEYLKRSAWPVHLVFDYGVAQELMLRDVWPSVAVVLDYEPIIEEEWAVQTVGVDDGARRHNDEGCQSGPRPGPSCGLGVLFSPRARLTGGARRGPGSARRNRHSSILAGAALRGVRRTGPASTEAGPGGGLSRPD